MRNEISALGVKKILLLLFLFFLSFMQIHAEEEKILWYQLYENRVNSLCKQDIYKTEKSILKKEGYIEYLDLDGPVLEKIKEFGGNIKELEFKKANWLLKGVWDGIDLAQEMYKYNMNTIYKCALINPQIKWLEEVQVLIANNPALKKKLTKKIDNKIKKLKKNKTAFQCSDNEPEKIDVLKIATQELCKYHSYLEYLKDYNSDISKLVDENGEKKEEIQSYNIWYIAQLEIEKKTLIGREIRRSYDIFPIAFDAYSQYETNLSIHLLLELIKEDYITLRRKLHDTINPINQVVYKIANAMKK